VCISTKYFMFQRVLLQVKSKMAKMSFWTQITNFQKFMYCESFIFWWSLDWFAPCMSLCSFLTSFAITKVGHTLCCKRAFGCDVVKKGGYCLIPYAVPCNPIKLSNDDKKSSLFNFTATKLQFDCSNKTLNSCDFNVWWLAQHLAFYEVPEDTRHR
jgi:hypothetical protein